jgi:hypothetical protein
VLACLAFPAWIISIVTVGTRFWPLIQRLLTFDDPAYKWVNVQKILKRLGLLSNDGTWSDNLDAVKDDRLQYAEQVSSLFFQKEAERFTPIALDSWRLQYGKSLNKDKAKDENDSTSAWTAALNCPTIFLALFEDGPWTDDARVILLKDMIEAFGKNTTTNEDIFDKLLAQNRHTLPGTFLPDSIVFVEGPTESVLLPALCNANGLDLNKAGTMIVAAGGANQVVRRYMTAKETFAIPIFCILDGDAVEQAELLYQNVREGDGLHVLEDGEIEDLVKIDALIPLLNAFIESLSVAANDLMRIRSAHFPEGTSRTKVLDRLWRERSLGKFDKVGFAEFMAHELEQDLSMANHLSTDGKLLISNLKKTTGV